MLSCSSSSSSDETAPTVNFTSPSTDVANPTPHVSGASIQFKGVVSDNKELKSITFSALTQAKTVNEFISNFNEELNSKKPASGSVLDKSELNIDFSFETLGGAPATDYTLTCTVVDKSDNVTTKTFYIKVE